MQVKKKPTRTCMACNEKKEKQELLRVVRTVEGNVEADLTGKKNGRGAYICKSEDCLNKVIKSKKLERILEKEISPEIYESIRGVIIGK
ncbi:MAG: YlxR family protein [Clostridia bacterium]|nr:YlxR family protein [Clostridia bacterium]